MKRIIVSDPASIDFHLGDQIFPIVETTGGLGKEVDKGNLLQFLSCNLAGNEWLFRHLLYKKANLLKINSRTKVSGFTALHVACRNLNLDAVKELLLRKADPVIQCEENLDTCLHILARMLKNCVSPMKKPLYDDHRDTLT